ncbi:MAG: NADH-quinone oxidoreductase subunit L, partial [Legionellales bacterium]|nr:NADH-quinone oxidoreductase subunit L [Legionellales bacterium]
IKKVVAYSTLSQLGYMIAATGASAYAVGMFHLVTHAFFKALLFLGAGSVIVALHHEQDMRRMGGLRHHMPVTFWTFLIGTLALTAVPPFAGFFSKDAIIEAVSLSNLPSATWASFCLHIGAYVTALYSFRALFMTFYGECKYTGGKITESHWTICMPLFLLAIGSICSGYILAPAIFLPLDGLLSSVIYLSPDAANVANDLAIPYSVGDGVIFEAFEHLPFWLTLFGFITAYYSYIVNKKFPDIVATKFNLFYRILLAKLGFDTFNEWFFVKGLKAISQKCYKIGDMF